VDLQVKKDDRDLCEDDKDLVDELFNPESLRRTEVSHRTLFCFTAQEIRTLNILVMLSKGTTQISEPMPLSATGDDRSALSEDTNKSEVIRTLCKHDRRRNQQDEGREDGPIIPSNSAILDAQACQKAERNAESRNGNQSNANSRGYRPCVSVWGFASLLLPSLSH
jgi:hypothetical protein